jgi:uncharacterized protein YuzE
VSHAPRYRDGEVLVEDVDLALEHLVEEVEVEVDVDGEVAEIGVVLAAVHREVQVHVQQGDATC